MISMQFSLQSASRFSYKDDLIGQGRETLLVVRTFDRFWTHFLARTTFVFATLIWLVIAIIYLKLTNFFSINATFC